MNDGVPNDTIKSLNPKSGIILVSIVQKGLYLVLIGPETPSPLFFSGIRRCQLLTLLWRYLVGSGRHCTAPHSQMKMPWLRSASYHPNRGAQVARNTPRGI